MGSMNAIRVFEPSRVIVVRRHQNDDDDRRDLNRTENLRPIPEGSEDFERLHVLRPDAESINRGIEDTLYINRASAKGWQRQMVDLLGYARSMRSPWRGAVLGNT